MIIFESELKVLGGNVNDFTTAITGIHRERMQYLNSGRNNIEAGGQLKIEEFKERVVRGNYIL